MMPKNDAETAQGNADLTRFFAHHPTTNGSGTIIHGVLGYISRSLQKAGRIG